MYTELKEQIVQIQKDISDLKKGQASSTATSEMDDLESFSPLPSSDSPFNIIPPSTNRLFSPLPALALSPPFVYRPRANSVPNIIPGQYDPFPVAMDCQSQTFPKKTDDMVLQSNLAGPSTSLSSPQSVQHLPVSFSQTAQPLSTTCTPSASLELLPTSPSQSSLAIECVDSSNKIVTLLIHVKAGLLHQGRIQSLC